MYGAPDHFQACAEFNIQPGIGMEIYEAVPHTFDLERDSDVFKIKWADLGNRQRYYHLTLWVMNKEGWLNLAALHTLSHTKAYKPKNQPLVDRAMLERHSAGLMVGLGCPASRTNITLKNTNNDVDAAYNDAKWYADVFEDRAYVEVMGNLPEQQGMMHHQRKIAKRLGIQVVSTNDVHYKEQADGVENGPHHIIVKGRRWKSVDIEKSNDKSDAGYGMWYGSDGFYMKSAQDMLETGFKPDEIERTVEVLNRINFTWDQLPQPTPPHAAIPMPGEDPAFDAFVSAIVT